VELKEESELEGKILKRYETGQLKDEYADFEEKEIELLKYPFGEEDDRKWPDALVFGNKSNQKPLNLSWEKIDNNFKLNLLSGNRIDMDYNNSIKLINVLKDAILADLLETPSNQNFGTDDELKSYFKSFQAWSNVLLHLYSFGHLFSNISDSSYPDKSTFLDNIIDFSKAQIWNFRNKLSKEIPSLLNSSEKIMGNGVWHKAEDDTSITGLPELFSSITSYNNNVNVLDLENIGNKTLKLMIAYYSITKLFELHKESISRYRTSSLEEKKRLFDHYKESNEPDPKDPRLRTFILIDEAHNFAPEDTNDPHEKMLGELIHTIAAEGRKYGLHLILATQRPNKVKRGLLGELDNAIIMKMNSRSDLEELAKEMRILDVKLLEPCLSFQGQGNAIAVGEMTRMAPYTQIFKSAPRRTKEGGVDIPFF